MTPPDTLAPDQRAVLELVLRQGRSYGELSELLAIPERDVRARADAGLRAMAGEPGPGVDSGRIADWLLGQQPGAEAERTRGAVARNPPARDWAATAAERLRELGGTIPEVPGADEPTEVPGADEPTAPSPTRRAAPEPGEKPAAAGAGRVPRSSRLGGAVLIGVLLLVVGGGLYLILGRGGEVEPQATTPAAEATATPTTEATANDIVLAGPEGSNAAGLMRLIAGEDDAVQFAIAAQNVPPNEGREVYAVWFTREGAKPRRLGFAQSQVTEEGVLTTGGPQAADQDRFPRWFATYEKILVTRETNAKATQPGPTVLQGTLPAGGD